MRCARCHRTINPDNALYDAHRRTYGPVCGARLGLTGLVMQAQWIAQRQQATRKKRKPSLVQVVLVDAGQIQLFEELT